jgi:flagellar biosynthesis/type III secretory pathway chaperone
MSWGMNALVRADALPPDALALGLAQAGELSQLLDDEHAALMRNDIAALEDLTPRKAALAEGLGHCISALGSPGALAGQPRWTALLDLAAVCRDRNLANAVLLQTRQQHLRQSLQPLLAGAGPLTYCQDGDRGLGSGTRSFGRA